ncbi:hypothetical protein ACTXKZ_18515 [Brachybacterium alimentarium]|uniref:hypothetical protein n=1 Tax=Brachybacterium alimentarium TaxID=47845 RepID=UPI003FD37CD1
MSTPSERLEAEIWLEANSPEVAPEAKDRFFVAVHEYYTQYPTADRRPDIAAILREDDEAFTLILRAVLSEDASRAPAAEDVPAVPSASYSHIGAESP